MTAVLEELTIDFASLVDKGANPGAYVCLIKRDGGSDPETAPLLDAVEKVGRKMAGKRLAAFGAAIKQLSELFAELNDASADDAEDDDKERCMSKQDAAPVEEPTMVEASAAPVEKAEQEAAIAKMAAEMAEVRKQLAAAEQVAKAERDARLTAEWVEVAKALPNLTADPKAFGPILKRAAEALSAEDMAEIQRVLRAADEQVAKSALLEPIGQAGAEGGESATDRINKLASDLVADGKAKHYADALQMVSSNPANRALAADYLAEQRSRN